MAVGFVPGATVRRSAAVPAIDTGGIAVFAAEPGLPATLGAGMLHGVFLSPATAAYPAMVLGFDAARALGIDAVPPAPRSTWGAGTSP